MRLRAVITRLSCSTDWFLNTSFLDSKRWMSVGATRRKKTSRNLLKYGPDAKLLGTMYTSLPDSDSSSADIAMNSA